VNKPSAQTGLAIMGVRVSAASTLAINFCNFSASAIVPTTETYTIGNFQVPTPGNGNVVYQSVVAGHRRDQHARQRGARGHGGCRPRRRPVTGKEEEKATARPAHSSSPAIPAGFLQGFPRWSP
jgi:hypothetical protein